MKKIKLNNPFRSIFNMEAVLTPIFIDARYDTVGANTLRKYHIIYIFGFRVMQIIKMEN